MSLMNERSQILIIPECLGGFGAGFGLALCLEAVEVLVVLDVGLVLSRALGDLVLTLLHHLPVLRDPRPGTGLDARTQLVLAFEALFDLVLAKEDANQGAKADIVVGDGAGAGSRVTTSSHGRRGRRPIAASAGASSTARPSATTT